MDGFQIRLELLHLLKYLNASQQSIQKILTFAMKYASKAEDVWSCIVSQCEKSTLNSKLNVLFLIDSLLTDDSGHSSPAIAAITYGPLAQRDLRTIILDLVVPKDNWDAVRLNAGSAQQILNSWKHKRLFDSDLLDQVDSELELRRKQLRKLPPSESASYGKFSKTEVLKRMEEDRERHKRLRERIWILPPKSFVDSLPSTSASRSALSSPMSQPRVIGSPKEPGSSVGGGSKDVRAVGVAKATSNASKANHKRESSGTSGNPRKKRKGEEDLTSQNLNSNENEEDKDETNSASASESNQFLNKGLDALEVEFEEAWETTSDLNEDDLENIMEEDSKWWGGEEGFKISLKEKEMQDEELKNSLGTTGRTMVAGGLNQVILETGLEPLASGHDGLGTIGENQNDQMILLQQEQQRLLEQDNPSQQELFSQSQSQRQMQGQEEQSQFHQQQHQSRSHSWASHQQQQQQAPSPQTPSGPSGYSPYQNYGQNQSSFRGGRGGGGGGMGRPMGNRGGFHNKGNQAQFPLDHGNNAHQGGGYTAPGINAGSPAAGRGGIRPIGIMNRGSAHVGRGRGRGWRQ